MADTPYKAVNTRPHWAGTAADLDIHLEEMDGLIDGTFEYQSIFQSQGLTTSKNVEGQSNTYRGDRIGAAQVKVRRSGDQPEGTRVPNEKFLITVDAVSYVRNPLDKADIWTAPDRKAELAREQGIAHAKFFDQAHLIQLIKAGAWAAPASLSATGNFFDGITKTTTGLNAASTGPAKAEILVDTHSSALTDFVRRDLGGSLAEFVTLCDPDFFNILLKHDKLMNVQYSGAVHGQNDFSARRVGILNGTRIIETPRFPTAAIASHPLGPQFNVSAAEAKSKMIVFHPMMTLLTVWAQHMYSDFWEDKENMTNVLDSMGMYNVGIRRGDACAVIAAE